jgi:hypothetical protein
MTVDHFGKAVAWNPGTALIEAKAGDMLDTLTLTVVASTATFDSIRISPRVFSNYVTDQFLFTATGYAYHLNQALLVDLTTQCTWISSAPTVFTLLNGKVTKQTAQGGSMFAAVNYNGLKDTVHFTMAQDLSLLLRINFQTKDTIYNGFWKADFGRPYTDSMGFGWYNTPYVNSYTADDNIQFDGQLFLTNSSNWAAKHPPNWSDTAIEGQYKIKCDDGDYIIKMCLGHPYYHGRLSYVTCGPNITKKNPNGSDTLFKFQVDNNYTTPLFGINTDTVVVRGQQGLFLNVFGPLMYFVIATSAGVNIDSIAYDKLPMPLPMDIAGAQSVVTPMAAMTISPNPFHPATRILLKGAYRDDLRIFSLDGRLVARLRPASAANGNTEYRWNAGNLPAGVYVASVKGKNSSLKKKMILMR